MPITQANSIDAGLFIPGPYKLLSYVPIKAVTPEFLLYVGDSVIRKKLPGRFEVRDNLNFIDIKILNGDEDFEVFMLCYAEERIWFNLGRDNKKGREYRLFPSGTIRKQT